MFNASFQSLSAAASNYINSTVVDSICTDAISGTVTVLFKSGAVYRYDNVSRRAIVKFNIDNAARSLGKFINNTCKADGVKYVELAPAMWSLLFNSFLMNPMNPLFELRRVVYRATEPGVEDITQLLGCYSTLDEADVARDQYRDRYPMSSLYIE